MKKTAPLLLFFMVMSFYGQDITTNRNPIGLEHNLLFNATTRYAVTQTGSAALTLDRLFDGKFEPSYTATGPGISDPTVVLIEGLPSKHTQAGAWIGWSTRHWNASRFKVEGYDIYNSANTWRVIADYSNTDYSTSDFTVKVPVSGSYTKLRFTFYTATGTNGRLGVSELFFIHPEATVPYEGLYQEVSTHSWQSGSNKLYYEEGNVGIGTTTPDAKLTVKGNIHTREVKVDLAGSVAPDYVFKEDYPLRSLEEVQAHIKEKGHLPGIPSAKEMEEEGIHIKEMNLKLLEKVEELTLYTIQLKEENDLLRRRVDRLEVKTYKN